MLYLDQHPIEPIIINVSAALEEVLEFRPPELVVRAISESQIARIGKKVGEFLYRRIEYDISP
jgi:hypothetical protein